mmetsp:Transcript_18627/g.34794  ORF Transcript_18627/g.34794 Transcript_18627/m.34794 type:complete len:129 (-) Transcript_18627:88-474(-)
MVPWPERPLPLALGEFKLMVVEAVVVEVATELLTAEADRHRSLTLVGREVECLFLGAPHVGRPPLLVPLSFPLHSHRVIFIERVFISALSLSVLGPVAAFGEDSCAQRFSFLSEVSMSRSITLLYFIV